MLQTDKFLQALHNEIDSSRYGTYPDELYEPIRYLMALNGKRLRPLLTLHAAALFTDEWEKALKPAHAVELFHNFTLMHDDIMDQAPLRRGALTVHKKWNENTAILSGDVMLVQAYEALAGIAPEYLPQALRRFNKTASEVCEGQQLDMNFESRPDVSIAEYIDMIRLKTSVLLGFALELGGLVGGAAPADTETLYTAGVRMGIGFQLKDDLLDVYGNPEKFGKRVGGDIISNKKTFLLLKALELADTSTREALQAWLTSDSASPEEKVAQVTALYDRLHVRELTEGLILSYFTEGMEALERLPVSSSSKTPLLAFIHYLMNREK